MGNCLSILFERAVGSWYDVEENGRVRSRFFLCGVYPMYEIERVCGGGSIREPCAACCRSEYLTYRVVDVISADVRRIQRQLDILSWRTLPPRGVVVALLEQSEQIEPNAPSTDLLTRDQIDGMYADTLLRDLPPRLVVFHILPYVEFSIRGMSSWAVSGYRDFRDKSWVFNPLDMWGYFARDITRHPFFLMESLYACYYLDIGSADFAEFLPYITHVTNLDISGHAQLLGTTHTYQRFIYLERLRLRTNSITLDNVAEFGKWLNTGTIRTLHVHLLFCDRIVLEAMKHLAKCCTDHLILRMGGYNIDLEYCLTFRETQLTCMEIRSSHHSNMARHMMLYPGGHVAYRPPFDQVFALLGVPHTVKYTGWFPNPDERHICDRYCVTIVEDA